MTFFLIFSYRGFGGSGAGTAFKFHFAETEGEAEGDVAAGVFAVGDAGAVGIDVGGTPAVPVEDVAGVEVEGEFAVEEVGTHAEVDAFALMADGEFCPAVRGGVVVAADEDFQFVPQFCPHFASDAEGEHLVDHRGLVGADEDAVPVVGEAHIEADVEEGCGTIHAVGVERETAAVATVVGHTVADHAVEIGHIAGIADGGVLVQVGFEGGAGTHGAKVGKIFVP